MLGRPIVSRGVTDEELIERKGARSVVRSALTARRSRPEASIEALIEVPTDMLGIDFLTVSECEHWARAQHSNRTIAEIAELINNAVLIGRANPERRAVAARCIVHLIAAKFLNSQRESSATEVSRSVLGLRTSV
jgi:hypothetical protein